MTRTTVKDLAVIVASKAKRRKAHKDLSEDL